MINKKNHKITKQNHKSQLIKIKNNHKKHQTKKRQMKITSKKSQQILYKKSIKRHSIRISNSMKTTSRNNNNHLKIKSKKLYISKILRNNCKQKLKIWKVILSGRRPIPYLLMTIKSSLLKILKIKISRCLSTRLINFARLRLLIGLPLVGSIRSMQSMRVLWKKKMCRFHRWGWPSRSLMTCLRSLLCSLWLLSRFRLCKVRSMNRLRTLVKSLRNSSELFFKNLKICRLRLKGMIM